MAAPPRGVQAWGWSRLTDFSATVVEGRTMRECLVVAYGAGVDSTAMLIGLWQRDLRPDAILMADTGGEKDQTYAFLPVMDDWLRDHDFPTITVVRNVVKNFKNWPPYHTLEENCLRTAGKN